MKVQDAESVFHTSGVSGKMDYEVASTAKMMNMLSNSLYKNKFAAVLRELGTNARDSHIMAGQTRKFEVFLPTRDKLELRIRDYGTGMAPEKLEKMYRVYGASDKTNSNDFNGCMGIGSKSPFCYATSFTSVSYYNGKKYTYINAKDERGIPSINRMGVDETDEPNGLEIILAVKAADVDNFANTAKTIYRSFPVDERPIVTQAGRLVEIVNHKYVMNGTGWAFTGVGDRYSNSNSSIVMGCVEYPIDIEHFVIQKTDSSGPSWYNSNNGRGDTSHSKLIRMGLNLFCNIGDVEMDISREGLQYTKATIQKIKDMLDIALKEIKEEISKRFVHCTNLWNARILYRDLIRGDLRALQEVVDLTSPDWKGHKLTSQVDVGPKNLPNMTELIYFSGRGNGRAYKNTSVFSIEAEKNIIIVENDINKGAHAACTRLCNENGNQVYLITFANPQGRQEFLDVLGADASILTLASSLPKPPRVVRGPVEKVFKHLGNESSSRSNWQAVDVDIEDGGFFVEISAWRPKFGEDEKHADSITSIIDCFKHLGITIPHSEIIGVKTIGVKKFQKRSDIWTNFFDWAKETLDKHLTQCKMSEDVALVNEVTAISNKLDKFTNLAKCKNADASPTSDFYKFTSLLNDAVSKKQKLQAKISAAISASNALGLEFDSVSKQDTLDKQMETIMAKYPMLNFVERWHVGDVIKQNSIACYINLVDKCG